MPKLLVIDDEPLICYSIRKIFSKRDVDVETASSLAEAREAVQSNQPDVIVLDLQLPDGTGMSLFDEIRVLAPKRPVIFITAHGTTDTAIQAMKHGAFDYLIKPIDLARMTAVLNSAFEAVRLMAGPAILPTDIGEDRLLGRSLPMQEMCKTIGRVAGQELNVLILGETGTGKELVARSIYQHSQRADKPFMAINCAAMPESLVESELFGHERGAFTGAHTQRIGKFEQCDGGTLLLDEIGDMPLPVQAKMLRLLQEQKFERLGGSQMLTTRVRVLAATNRNLEDLIREGRFRSDLYYRLKVVSINVPPLRSRKEDLPELAHHFLFRFAGELQRDIRGFSPAVLDLMQRYSWPGNVRELQTVLKEAVLHAVGQSISLEHLPLRFGQVPEDNRPLATGPGSLSSRIDASFGRGDKNVYATFIEEVEREVITHAMKRTRCNQSQASELLGINRTTLRTRLRDLGISVDKTVTDLQGESVPAEEAAD